MARTYESAAARWAGVGPYYAMFPIEFADKVIRRYTCPGDLVIDPFAGRGTAVFSAATQYREAVGIELNPVGYVYARTKLRPAQCENVERRIRELGLISRDYKEQSNDLPEFFHHCYSENVRRFLVAARARLDWIDSIVDRTVAALLMISLHGKRGTALSNQMRQAKSLSPQYAVRWWSERDLRPPELDPVEFMIKRINWRYAKGVPSVADSKIYLGDCRGRLDLLAREIRKGRRKKAKLLFTSPPYYAVTNYHYDQWLRLWLLGGPPNAEICGHGRGGKLESKPGYRKLLESAFGLASEVVDKSGTIYVRTDSRVFTCETTKEVLKEVFPRHKMRSVRQPLKKPSQTQLFGNAKGSNKKAAEIDLIMTPK